MFGCDRDGVSFGLNTKLLQQDKTGGVPVYVGAFEIFGGYDAMWIDYVDSWVGNAVEGRSRLRLGI